MRHLIFYYLYTVATQSELIFWNIHSVELLVALWFPRFDKMKKTQNKRYRWVRHTYLECLSIL